MGAVHSCLGYKTSTYINKKIRFSKQKTVIFPLFQKRKEQVNFFSKKIAILTEKCKIRASI